ncbi:GPO family capsid scaffolding protein [Aeromonas hydrophila]|uniref:GPO family capsid scaffolding protein n=1 Tax=Aeromonas hydrophila TaxID=644 RepID=UPI003D2050E4
MPQQTLIPTIRPITLPSSGRGTIAGPATAPCASAQNEEVDGKLKWYAIPCPNRDLISYNQSGKYQFCSIEPIEQFAYLGHTYLPGLGVTDEPNPRIRK